MTVYLDFEERIKILEEKLLNKQQTGDVKSIKTAKENLDKEVDKIFGNLNRFQKLQMARHPDRPHAIDYIKNLLDKDFYEIHGDRHFSDDGSIICYFGRIDGNKILIIGEEKGANTKDKLKRNFGMPNPEGYRKALRAAKLAAKFEIPIVTLIDTPGAYPGVCAEEHNQSEAIAKNLLEFSRLRVPIISIVIGEGGSGGALAIGVGDIFSMMTYSVYSVISPEGCAAILWNDPEKVKAAADAMKVLSTDLLKLKLIDKIIKEPIDGAHRNRSEVFKEVKKFILKNILELTKLNADNLVEKRYNKLLSFGKFKVKN